jgi:hypothetical protein
MINPIADKSYPIEKKTPKRHPFGRGWFYYDDLNRRITRYGGVSGIFDMFCSLCEAENSPLIACRHTQSDRQNNTVYLTSSINRHPKDDKPDRFTIEHEDDDYDEWIVHVGFRICRNK